MKPILRLFGLKSFLIIFLILTGFNVTGQLGIKVDNTFSSDTTFQPFQGNYQTYQHAIHEKTINPKITEGYLKVYPNPASDYIVVDYNYSSSQTDMIISITGINSQILKSVKIQRFKDQKIIDIHDIQNGMYIVSFVSGQKKLVSQKVIIQR